ncbi:MAG: hypothetical protein GY749_02860 [Desulfobacteraceae bacterium]|nr:hypothetical protein [Desulfobacteraceae bacterium]
MRKDGFGGFIRMIPDFFKEMRKNEEKYTSEGMRRKTVRKKCIPERKRESRVTVVVPNCKSGRKHVVRSVLKPTKTIR